MNHLPEVFQVGIASPDEFASPYRWVNYEEGNTCPVLHARFALQNGRVFDGYAKLLDLQTAAGQAEYLNEITGWLIAKACGLPVAPSAFLAGISASDLPDCKAVRDAVSGSGSTLYFFCTEAVSPSQARGIVANEALVTEQFAWPFCHATIALDEWLGNADRHVHNFVRRAKNDFVLIDHGQLLRRTDTPPWWRAGELSSLQETFFANKLHSNVYLYANVSEPSKVTLGYQKSTQSATAQGDNMRRALHEIAYWCKVIAPGQSAEWLAFLLARCEQADTLLCKRFGQLQLSHA